MRVFGPAAPEYSPEGALPVNSQHGSAEARLRRAAVLLSALGPAASQEIAGALSPEQQRALGQAGESLTDISAEERRCALRSFAAACQSASAVTTPADPVPSGRAPRDRHRAPGEETDRIPCQRPLDPPFQFLEDANPALIAACLADETPEIVALVAASTREWIAHGILSELPAEFGGQVAVAIADLSRKPVPGALRCLSDGLREELCARREQMLRRREAALTIARALDHADPEATGGLLDALRQRDPALAREVALEIGLSAEPAEPTPDDAAPAEPAQADNVLPPEPACSADIAHQLRSPVPALSS